MISLGNLLPNEIKDILSDRFLGITVI